MFVCLTCKLKVLWEDIQTTEKTTLYILVKNAIWAVFRPILVCYSQNENVIRLKCF